MQECQPRKRRCLRNTPQQLRTRTIEDVRKTNVLLTELGAYCKQNNIETIQQSMGFFASLFQELPWSDLEWGDIVDIFEFESTKAISDATNGNAGQPLSESNIEKLSVVFSNLISDLWDLELEFDRESGDLPAGANKSKIRHRFLEERRIEGWLKEWKMHRPSIKKFISLSKSIPIDPQDFNLFLREAILLRFAVEVSADEISTIFREIEIDSKCGLGFYESRLAVEVTFSVKALSHDINKIFISHGSSIAPSFHRLFFDLRKYLASRSLFSSEKDFYEDMHDLLAGCSADVNFRSQLLQALEGVAAGIPGAADPIARRLAEWRCEEAWLGTLRLQRAIMRKRRVAGASGLLSRTGDVAGEAANLLAELLAAVPEESQVGSQSLPPPSWSETGGKFSLSESAEHASLEDLACLPVLTDTLEAMGREHSDDVSFDGISGKACAPEEIAVGPGLAVDPRVEWDLVVRGHEAALGGAEYPAAAGRLVERGLDHYVEMCKRLFGVVASASAVAREVADHQAAGSVGEGGDDRDGTAASGLGSTSNGSDAMDIFPCGGSANAGVLSVEEVAALRLWTGPRGRRYASLWAAGQSAAYATTAHALRSAALAAHGGRNSSMSAMPAASVCLHTAKSLSILHSSERSTPKP